MTTKMGWGTRRPKILRHVDLPYVGLEKCKSAMKPLNISDNMLCSGFKFMMGSCRGYSGGPVVYRANSIADPRKNNLTFHHQDHIDDDEARIDRPHDMVLAGITTWVGCGKHRYSVYTDVASYAEWIDKNMKQN